ncbi:hypothetical protein EJ04DRAFT_514093 [Polyplosphaeria fusca]|uniref:Uncharacterized protein n=1 Tax=Polyplosphaeria fusca TaxID=682080 RepID=A0A9P4QWF1_9PLEO|nr:hypothetical protein EJ04DRAFT_514093 [Polyplosphaeria fusca]
MVVGRSRAGPRRVLLLCKGRLGPSGAPTAQAESCGSAKVHSGTGGLRWAAVGCTALRCEAGWSWVRCWWVVWVWA